MNKYLRILTIIVAILVILTVTESIFLKRGMEISELSEDEITAARINNE